MSEVIGNYRTKLSLLQRIKIVYKKPILWMNVMSSTRGNQNIKNNFATNSLAI